MRSSAGPWSRRWADCSSASIPRSFPAPTRPCRRCSTSTRSGLGFTVAIAMIGTIVGSLAVGKPADVFGRKNVLFALAVCFFVSAAGCGLAQSWWEFLLARFIGGLAIGGASVVTPMYIAEISPPHLRGRLVMVNQLNIVLGVLLSYVSNYRHRPVLSRSTWPGGGCWDCWRCPRRVLFVLIFSVPESPRSLVKRGRRPRRRRSSNGSAKKTWTRRLAAIQASLADQPGHAQERLFRRAYWRPVFLASAMAVFNQLTGINAMLYYAPNIFSMAGALRDSSLLQSIAIGGTLFVFTIVAMFIIDRFGRRILLLIGSVGMALCLALLAGSLPSAPTVPTEAGSWCWGR